MQKAPARHLPADVFAEQPATAVVREPLSLRGRSATRGRGSRRRGSTLILVLWAIGVTTIAVVSIQMAAFRQASAGRETLAQVRAKWAARAGVESTIAYLAWATESGERVEPRQLQSDLETLAYGSLYVPGENEPVSRWIIEHTVEGEVRPGPLDPGSRINVNLMELETLIMLDDMEQATAIALLDWIDSNEEPRPDGGAEAREYEAREFIYEPRNGPVRSLDELMLVEALDPVLLWGEDMNGNGRLDPNEDDGDLLLPNDDADGTLWAGWSELITAVSREMTMAPSGEPRLDLAEASESDIRRRLDIDQTQARALSLYAQANPSSALISLINIDLSRINEEGGLDGIPADGGTGGDPGGGGGGGETGGEQVDQDQPRLLGAENLTDDQLQVLLDEAIIGDPAIPRVGKVNLNTASEEVLMLLPAIDEQMASRIVTFREATPGGIASIINLLEVEGMTRARVANLARRADVRSGAYVVQARGVADPGAFETDLTVVVDRSHLPVRIISYEER